MAQFPTRPCRNCGAPLMTGQRFCSKCGSVAEEGTSTPTTTPSSDNYSPVSDMSTIMSSTPPPPPPDSLPYSQYPAMQSYPQNVQQPIMQAPQQATPPPDYAVPQTTSATPILQRIGCGLGVFLILCLALCGAAGYFAYNGIRNATTNTADTIRSAQKTGSGYGSTTGSGNTTTPTASAATTTPINATLTYASITTTILDAKQAQSFSDDTSSDGQGSILRLDIKEQNATDSQPNYLYSEILRLLLPNQQVVSPLAEQMGVSPNASTTRTNWIDFAVPTTTNVSQLTLVFGDDTQAQMQVPLTGKADLTQYQAKTATLSKTTQYAGLKWTVKTATRSWNNEGKQAKKGMYYVVLDMSIDNPSSNSYTSVWQDDLRLKAGDITSSPDSSNIPSAFSANSSGTQGTVAFLVPQTATAYTFIILPDSEVQGSSQATIDFQI